jgi:hypothetical protein
MRRWRPAPHTLRQLDDRQVRLILLRGGMLQRTAGKWHAYRSLDSRRMRVGIVPDSLADHLLAEGLAGALDGPAPRLGPGPRLGFYAAAT